MLTREQITEGARVVNNDGIKEICGTIQHCRQDYFSICWDDGIQSHYKFADLPLPTVSTSQIPLKRGPQPRFEFLSEAFLQAMEDIGRYGYEKHKENSFKSMLANGNTTRKISRHSTEEIMRHARNHTHEYEAGLPHDHFNDLLHQLAAVAFNAMVEAQFAGLAKDE